MEIVEGTGPLVEPLPFTDGEYAQRLAALRATMATAGLDAFVAFGPENITWLTGHDTPPTSTCRPASSPTTARR